MVKLSEMASLVKSPLLELRDTLYSVSGFRSSRLYCVSLAERSTSRWTNGSELGPYETLKPSTCDTGLDQEITADLSVTSLTSICPGESIPSAKGGICGYTYNDIQLK